MLHFEGVIVGGYRQKGTERPWDGLPGVIVDTRQTPLLLFGRMGASVAVARTGKAGKEVVYLEGLIGSCRTSEGTREGYIPSIRLYQIFSKKRRSELKSVE